jgi:hypothetical protein
MGQLIPEAAAHLLAVEADNLMLIDKRRLIETRKPQETP